MPLFGPPNIKNLEAKKNIKGLIQALGYQKDDHSRKPRQVRIDAADALGRIGDASAGEALMAMFALAFKTT